MAAPGEIVVHLLHHGGGGIGKVDGHRAAHSRAHLIHEAAGLAEVDVFGILADLRHLDGVETCAAVVVQDIRHQHLIGGGGGKPRTRQYIGGHTGIKALQCNTHLRHLGSYATHQGGGGALLFLAGQEIIERDGQLGIALGTDADHILAIGCGAAEHIEVDAAAQDVTMLMVGVVAADLRTTRTAEERYISRCRKTRSERFHHGNGTVFGLQHGGLVAIGGIEGLENMVISALLQGADQLFTSAHMLHLPLSLPFHYTEFSPRIQYWAGCLFLSSLRLFLAFSSLC